MADFGELSRAVRDVFNNRTVNVLPTSPSLRRTRGELHRSLSPTSGAYTTALAGKRDKERAITSVAVYSNGTMSEDSASAFGKPTARQG
ncbi:MAG: hypothetical protein RL326_262 [Pseudomonadota bacterium]